MNLPTLPRFRLEHVLGIALALFAILALWPWLVPEAGSAPPPGKPAAATPELSALPRSSALSAIVDRPLFSPTRRPVPGVASANKGIETRYQLLGIVISETVRRAWLAEGPRHFEIGQGDKLDGWTVARIEQDRLILTSPSGEAVLALRPPAEEPGKEAAHKEKQ